MSITTGARRRATLAAALLLAANAPLAAAPAALCSRPEVLEEVGRIVRGWNVYNTIDEASVSEAPTPTTNAVVCFATLQGIGYVNTPRGWQRRRTEETRRYDVQVTGNRFVVQVPR